MPRPLLRRSAISFFKYFCTALLFFFIVSNLNFVIFISDLLHQTDPNLETQETKSNEFFKNKNKNSSCVCAKPFGEKFWLSESPQHLVL